MDCASISIPDNAGADSSPWPTLTEHAAAAIEGTQVRYEEGLRELQVKSVLSRSGGVSQREAERARATAQVLAAELASGKARERIRAAGVEAARAALERAQIDLKRTIIKSPIDGVVIRRPEIPGCGFGLEEFTCKFRELVRLREECPDLLI